MKIILLCVSMVAFGALLAGCSKDSKPDAVKQAVEQAFYDISGCRAFEVRNVKLQKIETVGKGKFSAFADLDLVARMSKVDTDKVCNDPNRNIPAMHDPSPAGHMLLRWQIMQFDAALHAGKRMVNAGDTVHVSNAELHVFKADHGWRLAGDHS